MQGAANLTEFASPPAGSRQSAGVSSTRGLRIWVGLFLLRLAEEGAEVRICACLFWSFGASHAGRCEFGPVWGAPQIRPKTPPLKVAVFSTKQRCFRIPHFGVGRRGVTRSVAICSNLLRFLPMCVRNESEQIRGSALC